MRRRPGRGPARRAAWCRWPGSAACRRPRWSPGSTPKKQRSCSSSVPSTPIGSAPASAMAAHRQAEAQRPADEVQRDARAQPEGEALARALELAGPQVHRSSAPVTSSSHQHGQPHVEVAHVAAGRDPRRAPGQAQARAARWRAGTRHAVEDGGRDDRHQGPAQHSAQRHQQVEARSGGWGRAVAGQLAVADHRGHEEAGQVDGHDQPTAARGRPPAAGSSSRIATPGRQNTIARCTRSAAGEVAKAAMNEVR